MRQHFLKIAERIKIIVNISKKMSVLVQVSRNVLVTEYGLARKAPKAYPKKFKLYILRKQVPNTSYFLKDNSLVNRWTKQLPRDIMCVKIVVISVIYI